MRSEFEGAKVLITGGLGFIGSNLARRLAGLGADLTLVDSLIPEYGGNLFNIEGFQDQMHVNVSDVRDTYSLEPLVRGKDYLFNLAGSEVDRVPPVAPLDLATRLAGEFSPAQQLDIMLLTGWYHGISYVARAANLVPEDFAARFATYR